MSKRYWLALDNLGKILAFGLTSSGRFSRQCFAFSVETYVRWEGSGGRYVELLSDEGFSGVRKGDDYRQHRIGHIRYCQSTLTGREPQLKPFHRQRVQFECAHCGKLTAGRRPRQGRAVGDGTFMYPRRHKGSDGKPCPGNNLEATWITPPQPIECNVKYFDRENEGFEPYWGNMMLHLEGRESATAFAIQYSNSYPDEIYAAFEGQDEQPYLIAWHGLTYTVTA